MPEISSQRVEKLASAVATLTALVDEFRGASAEASPEIRKRVAAYIEVGKCLRCGEVKGGRYTRGMDVNCYNATMKEIGRAEVTEAELIVKGRITERALPGGRRSTRPPASEIGELPEFPDEAADLQGELVEKHAAAKAKKLAAKKPT